MDLRAEFHQLWLRLGCQGHYESEWFRREISYTNPWRHYHTLTHIKHVVSELISIQSRLQRPDEALWTAFDHDVILHIPALSAEFALETLNKANVDHPIALRISNQIKATDHKVRVLDDDTQYVLDADKAILGQRWAVYGQYAFRDIPQEYLDCGVTRKAFTVGRLAFLQKLREKPIYLTQYFGQLYEEMARLNINQEIRILTKQLA